MIIEEIGRGATVEEATEDAKLKLGVRDDEDIQIDVISMPKKKVLGIFGGSGAEVKVSVERALPKGEKREKGRHDKKDRKEQKENKEQKKEPAREEKKGDNKAKKDPPAEAVDAESLTEQNRSFKAIAYLKSVLPLLGCENVTMKVAEGEDSAVIYLEGEGLGIVIGHRGETLDAFQHLASLASRTKAGYYKITLNIGDYRERREDALAALATRMAAQVLKSGRGKALEPMNPYERRIIHTTLQEIEGVTSASVGEGENRRVVITVEGGDVKDVRFDRSRRSGDRDRRGGRRPRRGGGDKITAPSREPKSDSDMPLYGKIK